MLSVRFRIWRTLHALRTPRIACVDGVPSLEHSDTLPPTTGPRARALCCRCPCRHGRPPR
ncbi:hypothetical protein CBM2585_A40363 [Cupriavidus taiwanensis]|nr:hypothetical protein CBM2585_A40363 [Cupriavidus taiwanensis]